MKLHDLRPAAGAHKARTRVGRGIAGGKGKTAGRGTKGQKARAGGTIPAWFEGGQTPIHIRIPKLRGFKVRNRVEYEIVNLGRISHLIELGELELAAMPGSKSARTAPITINQDILREVGLVTSLNKPLKILGHGEINVALFVVADAFTKSAVTKIEAAGGSVQVLEIPSSPMAALTGTAGDAQDPAEDRHPAPTGRRAGTAPTASDAPAASPAKASVKATAKVPAKSSAPAKAAPTAKATAKATGRASAGPVTAAGSGATTSTPAEATAPDAGAELTEPAADASDAVVAEDQMPAGEAG